MIKPIKKIALDPDQLELESKLDIIIDSLNSGLFTKLFRAKQPSGIYIYGSVGSGKSMLARSFFDKVSDKKLFVHYQDFMRSIHQFFHDNQGQSKNGLISKLAQSYAGQAGVICLDEFEIKDITDAMLIGRLVTALVKRGIFIVMTTNTAPFLHHSWLKGTKRPKNISHCGVSRFA